MPDADTLEANLSNLMQRKFPDPAGNDIVTNATWESHERALKTGAGEGLRYKADLTYTTNHFNSSICH